MLHRVLVALVVFVVVGLSQASAAEMSFSIVSVGNPAQCGDQCPLAIAAQGEITNSTPDAFASFVSSNARSDIVFLDSPGGKVLSSMELGQAFRRLGVAAVVARPIGGSGSQLAAGHCYSACVYALMGARQRMIPPQSRVGIHRMFSYDSSVDPAGGINRSVRHDDGGMREIVARYSSSMGVSRGLIDAAEQTSSEGIHVLSQTEIARWHLGASRVSLGEGPAHRRRRRH